MKQGWKTCKFADVFDLQMGKTPSRDNPTYWGDDNMWVSIADMNEQKYMSATKEGITDVAVQESGIKPIPKGTVIMSFKLSIGKVSIATSKLYTNEAIMGFIEKEEGTLVPEYLYYYLKGYKWEGANKAAMGMTLNKKTIAENTISYPPIAEQEKIVAELDCLSEIIEKKKQQLKELDNLAQSIFYEMFGDPVENDKGWETKKVIDVVKLQRGYDLPIQYRQSDGGIPVWGSNGIVGWHNEAKVDYGVITGRSGTLGTVYSYDKPFFPLNTTLFSVDTHGNDIVYLKCLLNIFDLKRFGTGTGVPTLNRNVFHSEPIISVPLALQQDFASKIESIEKQKELITQSIKETETLFNSRMDYYFN